MKKILAGLLTIALIVTMLPSTVVKVRAEEAPQTYTTSEVEQLEREGSATLVSRENWYAPGGYTYVSKGKESSILLSNGNDAELGQTLIVETVDKPAAAYTYLLNIFYLADVKAEDVLYFTFRIRGLSTQGDTGSITTNVRIQQINGDGTNQYSQNGITADIDGDWVTVSDIYVAPTDCKLNGNGEPYGNFMFQLGAEAQKFEIADFRIYDLSMEHEVIPEITEPVITEPIENSLEWALAKSAKGDITNLTKDMWNYELKGGTVSAEYGEDAELGKTLVVENTEAGNSYAKQLYLFMNGSVQTGHRLLYFVKIRGISAEGSERVTMNLRLRPDNGNGSTAQYQFNDMGDEIDAEGVWAAYSGIYTAEVAAKNGKGSFILQFGAQAQKFELGEFYVFDLDLTDYESVSGGDEDEGGSEEETTAEMTMDELNALIASGKGRLVSYSDIEDAGAYTKETQDPLTNNGTDFATEIVSVTGQPFTKAIKANVTKQANDQWDAQLFFNFVNDANIKKGDTLYLSCYVKGLSTLTNKESGLVIVKSRIRPSRSAAASTNFDFSANIYANEDAGGWTHIYGAVVAMADSNAEVTDVNKDAGTWVLQLAGAVQALEVADVKIYDFGTEYSVKAMPSMAIGYIGMEEGSAWRTAALERIEQIRKQDLTVNVTDQNGNPIKDADVRADMKRHEFGFGTIVNVNKYNGLNAADKEKYKEALGLIAHNRVGFENSLKAYYLYDEERVRCVDEWIEYFKEQNYDVRGHVLVYGSDNRLKTVTSRDGEQDLPNKDLLISGTEEGNQALSDYVENHITTFATKYKDDLYIWDVVNEDYKYNDWEKRLNGVDSIVRWFELAHECAPDAKLAYNDYGMVNRDSKHCEFVHDLLETLIEKNAPITTLGMQGHIGIVDPISVINNIEYFSDLGLEIEITEFTSDVVDEKLQAQYLKDFMIAVFSEKAVTSITTWGFIEGAMAGVDNAAMVKADYTLKKNGEVWRDMIYNEWWTNEAGRTGINGSYKTRGYKGQYDVQVTVNGVTKNVEVNLSGEPVELNVQFDRDTSTIEIIDPVINNDPAGNKDADTEIHTGETTEGKDEDKNKETEVDAYEDIPLSDADDSVYGNTPIKKASGSKTVTVKKKDGKYVDSKGTIVTKSIVKTKSGKMLYLNANGNPAKNVLVKAGKKLYVTNMKGEIITDRVVELENGSRVIAKSNGVLAKNAFVKAPNGYRVYADENCILKTGLFTVKDKMYYASKKGNIKTDVWVKVDDVQYYCNGNGVITWKKMRVGKTS